GGIWKMKTETETETGLRDDYGHPLPLRLRDPNHLVQIQKTYFKSSANDLIDKERFLVVMREMSRDLIKAHYDLMSPVDKARADATIAKLEAMR
ncbi:MAG: hypothetical protein WBP49_04090, partial [Acidimicrobiia bacterium]